MMRYWWVCQNKTYEQEVPGNFLWSPKRKSNGYLNHYYETMREVSRGDLVFSFKSRKIMALGIAVQPAYTCPKPADFDKAGINWNDIGWRVDVDFHELQNNIEPRQHMQLLQPLLPSKYAPLKANGDGQELYLTELPKALAEVLIGLIGIEAQALIGAPSTADHFGEEDVEWLAEKQDIVREWELREENLVLENKTLAETEKTQIVKSRIGQGLFRNRVAKIEKHCRVTRVDNQLHLIASHIKPWKTATNVERLDGENGLLLTPNADHLFDKGFISFENDGGLIVSPIAHKASLTKMGILVNDDLNVGGFSKNQQQYLEYHRDCILLRSKN